MESYSRKLDFDMQILLIHALKSEARIIRQAYPLAEKVAHQNGQELIRLDKKFSLLRTGIGLEACRLAIERFVDPNEIDQVIHFGVSGSLSMDIPVLQTVRGRRFLSPGVPELNLSTAPVYPQLELPDVSFYASPNAIVDEDSRDAAIQAGGEVVDMESYAVASFCHSQNLPLLALRCTSDRAGESTVEDFKNHYSAASTKLQHLLLEKIL